MVCTNATSAKMFLCRKPGKKEVRCGGRQRVFIEGNVTKASCVGFATFQSLVLSAIVGNFRTSESLCA